LIAVQPARRQHNNMVAKVKLIPRADFWRDEVRTEDGDYATQAGAPYGLFRRFCNHVGLAVYRATMGLLTAIDMSEGKIRWQIPLGSMQDFGGKQPPIPPGSISLGGRLLPREEWSLIAGTYDPFIRPLMLRPGRNCGRHSCQTADTPPNDLPPQCETANNT